MSRLSAEKCKGAVDNLAELDGFRSETALDVGFARAGEGLFAAIRVHVSHHRWSLLHPGQEDIMFTSTINLFLSFFSPPPPSDACPQSNF